MAVAGGMGSVSGSGRRNVRRQRQWQEEREVAAAVAGRTGGGSGSGRRNGRWQQQWQEEREAAAAVEYQVTKLPEVCKPIFISAFSRHMQTITMKMCGLVDCFIP